MLFVHFISFLLSTHVLYLHVWNNFVETMIHKALWDGWSSCALLVTLFIPCLDGGEKLKTFQDFPSH
jgi:hypothetical protein